MFGGVVAVFATTGGCQGWIDRDKGDEDCTLGKTAGDG